MSQLARTAGKDKEVEQTHERKHGPYRGTDQRNIVVRPLQLLDDPGRSRDEEGTFRHSVDDPLTDEIGQGGRSEVRRRLCEDGRVEGRQRVVRVDARRQQRLAVGRIRVEEGGTEAGKSDGAGSGSSEALLVPRPGTFGSGLFGMDG